MKVRPYIDSPSGRRYSGRYPQQVKAGIETPYILELAKSTNGVCEVVLPVGRADVACASTVFEVEPVKTWRTGLRQALGYAGQTGWKPGLALFGPADYERIYLFLRDHMPEAGVTLWIWRGEWERITNRNRAKIKKAPLIPQEQPVPTEPSDETSVVPGDRATALIRELEEAAARADSPEDAEHLMRAAQAHRARASVPNLLADRL